VFNRLKQHLINNDILAVEQYGFCSGVSIQTAVFKLTDLIHKAWNNKELVVGVFCDLTRAFDCFNRDLLIRRLEYYGVRGCILKWLDTYLFNRKQRVVLLQSLSGKLAGMVFPRDLFWAHCCSMFILMISQVFLKI
jgi:hypothetical protein